MKYFKCLAVILAMQSLFSVVTARAHDYWLEPEHFTVPPGSEVKLKLYLGQDFKPEKERPLQADRTPKLDLYSSPKRSLSLLHPENFGKSPVAIFSISKSGTRLAAMERNRSTTSFGRVKFLQYVEHEGLGISANTLPADKKSVRESHSRYLKALIQCGEKMSSAGSAMIDAPFQIVLSRNPYELKKTTTVGVRLFYENRPLARSRLAIFHRTAAGVTRTDLTTDERGHARLIVSPEGRWLIRAIHIEPAPEGNPERADFQSVWTSLTFGYD